MASILWDHSVHYVNDLDDAIEAFAHHGLCAFRGGSHKPWGTYNALSYFGLTYHEFLAIEDQALAANTDHHNHVVRDAVRVLPTHQVLSRVALRTDDIDAIYDRLVAFGLSVAPIISGSRLNKQGELIEWRMLTIGGAFQGLPYPFIIQWKESDEVRQETLARQGIIAPHPVGHVALTEAVFSVDDPQAVATHWHQLFGFPLSREHEDVHLQVEDKRFVFKPGSHNRLDQLNFLTDAQPLRGQTIKIGEGRYAFF